MTPNPTHKPSITYGKGRTDLLYRPDEEEKREFMKKLNPTHKLKNEFEQEFHAIFGHDFDNNIDVMWQWVSQALATREQEVREECRLEIIKSCQNFTDLYLDNLKSK